MSDVFISYARSTAKQAQAVAEALRSLGHTVWLDDELPAHRAYTDVIEERLKLAKAVVVIWSAEAAKSHWVRAEANTALEAGTLVQLTVDGVMPPMPFNQIQCADLAGWSGNLAAPSWRKVAASVADLVGGDPDAAVAVEAPLALPTKPSVAVMPFANLSGDPEQDYFAEGMAVEITAALSRIRLIFVVASGSTLSFKGKTVSAQEIGRLLGVRFVLEGSVRKAANRVRIALQLIDASDGAQVWTDRFEDTLDDVFALQDRVALSVAAKIEPTIRVADMRRAARRPPESRDCYDLYLRALPLGMTYTQAGVLEGLDLVNRALAIDPEFTPAMGIAASCHYMIAAYVWADDLESHRRQAVELAHRLLRVAGDDAYALTCAALPIADFEQDLDGAIAVIDRATVLNPSSALAWSVSGALLGRAGELERGVADIETSMRLDPIGLSRVTQVSILAWFRLAEGRFAEAVTLSKEYLQQVDGPMGYACLASSYGHLGQATAAREALTRYRALAAQPIEDLGRLFIPFPTFLKVFLDGIALAEGLRPSGDPA